MRWYLALLLALALGCGEPTVVFPEVLVVTLAPSHGSVDIALDVEVLAAFSHEVDEAAPLAASLSLECLGAPPCSAPDASVCVTSQVATNIAYDAASQVARMVPQASLASNVCHVVLVRAGVAAKSSEVGALRTDVRAVFLTR